MYTSKMRPEKFSFLFGGKNYSLTEGLLSHDINSLMLGVILRFSGEV